MSRRLPGPKVDYTGMEIGHLVVLNLAYDTPDPDKGYMWNCFCEICEKEVLHPSSILCRRRKSQTCGVKACISKIKEIHGDGKVLDDGTRDALYRLWVGMRSRCRTGAYKNKVHVEEEWNNEQTGYFNFKTWMLLKYPNFYKLHKLGYQLDRIGNRGPYASWNCRYTTRRINVNNRENSVWAIINGVHYGLVEILEQYRPNTNPQTVHERLKGGWSLRDAIFLLPGECAVSGKKVRKALTNYLTKIGEPYTRKLNTRSWEYMYGISRSQIAAILNMRSDSLSHKVMQGFDVVAGLKEKGYEVPNHES